MNRRAFAASCISYLASFSSQGLARSLNRVVSDCSTAVWRTSRSEKYRKLDVMDYQPPSRNGTQAVVTVDLKAPRQSILGFGGAFTDASCYLLSTMEETARVALMRELLHPDHMALNLCRVCVGASDYSRNAYTYDDNSVPDEGLASFSINHDKAYILPILREACAIRPSLFLFGTPWSPPGWMKSGKSIYGGMIEKRYFDAYARYLVRFLLEYKQEGISVQALTIQNEVDTDQDGHMPACLWGQEYEIQFIKDHLGPALAAAGLSTRLWILDHNYNLWGRALDELSDTALANYVDGVAWHGYGGAPSDMTRVHDMFPTKSMYWTEGGPDITSATYRTDWCKWSNTFSDILNNWSRSLVVWNLLLDEKGGPNIGPFPCGGLVTIEPDGLLVRSGQYWALQHFSHHITRGSRILPSLSSHPGVGSLAFTDTKGTHGVVITNASVACDITVLCGNHSEHLQCPADSISTVVFTSHLA